jgi:uncharacterized protein (TIGR00369 family)
MTPTTDLWNQAPCLALLRTYVLHAHDGEALARIETHPGMCNPYGLIQGGILVAMLDNLIGLATISAEPERAPVAIALHVHFLRPVRPGRELLGQGRVTRRGQGVLFAEAELFRQKRPDQPVAKVSATCILGRPNGARPSLGSLQ